MKAWLLASLLLSTAAHAAGTCAGGGLAGTVGIAYRDSTGNTLSVAAAASPFVFGAAECECGTDDLLLDIFLTQAFPMGAVGTVEVWSGTGCDINVTARTAPGTTTCEKLVGPTSFSDFVTGGGSSSHIYVPISSLALFSPVAHMCPSTGASNGLYLLFFTGSNSSPSGIPAATCSLETIEEVAGVGAPTNPTTTAGDRAVTLSWGAPAASQPQPTAYQVLCADAAGNPIESAPPPPAYSTCVGGTIERRPLPTGGTLGGTAPTPSPVSGGGGSGGSFAELDRRFVCSDAIPATAGPIFWRVTGLENGKRYQLTVVSVDDYGNATAAPSVMVDLPSHNGSGCTIAGGSNAGAWPFLLAPLLALFLRRRRVSIR